MQKWILNHNDCACILNWVLLKCMFLMQMSCVSFNAHKIMPYDDKACYGPWIVNDWMNKLNFSV